MGQTTLAPILRAGQDSDIWPVVLLLFAVLVPAVCLLWFMAAAMRNERRRRAKACGGLSGATFRLASATSAALEGNGGRVGEIGGGNACVRSFRQMRAVWNRGRRRHF